MKDEIVELSTFISKSTSRVVRPLLIIVQKKGHNLKVVNPNIGTVCEFLS